MDGGGFTQTVLPCPSRAGDASASSNSVPTEGSKKSRRRLRREKYVTDSTPFVEDGGVANEAKGSARLVERPQETRGRNSIDRNISFPDDLPGVPTLSSEMKDVKSSREHSMFSGAKRRVSRTADKGVACSTAESIGKTLFLSVPGERAQGASGNVGSRRPSRKSPQEVADRTPGATGIFQELLVRVGEQHENELAALLAENAALRSKIEASRNHDGDSSARVLTPASSAKLEERVAPTEAQRTENTALGADCRASPSPVSDNSTRMAPSEYARGPSKEIAAAVKEVESGASDPDNQEHYESEGSGYPSSRSRRDYCEKEARDERTSVTSEGDVGTTDSTPVVLDGQELSDSDADAVPKIFSGRGGVTFSDCQDAIALRSSSVSAKRTSLAIKRCNIGRLVRVSHHNLELKRVWEEDLSRTTGSRRMSKKALPGEPPQDLHDVVIYSKTKRWCSKLILHPSCLKRLTWDLLGFAFLSYDIVQVPFSSAFDVKPSRFMQTLNWITGLFWTMDVFATLITGFQKGGHTVMVHSAIVINYLKTWFAADMMLVSLDWFVMVAVEGGIEAHDGFITQGRSLRMLRYIRTLRLIRLLKLKRIMNEIQDHINTEVISTIFGVLKTITALIVANHLIACAWFALGVSALDEAAYHSPSPAKLVGKSWVEQNYLLSESIAYQYTTSLHWSFTQFTPASMEIRPYNVAERIFSIVVLLLALVSFSSFVSTLTASVTRLSSLKSDEVQQFWRLRRYLQELQISRALSLRVQRYCEYSWEKRKQRVQERDVVLLQHLSEQLHEELKAETFAPHLAIHPMMMILQDCVRLFSKCLESVEIASGDLVFGYGEVAHAMYFVATGDLQYSKGHEVIENEKFVNPIRTSVVATPGGADSDSNSSNESHYEPILKGDWVSELALWVTWDHLGFLDAPTDGQLIAVKAEEFSGTVSQNIASMRIAQGYAKAFFQILGSVDSDDVSDVLDRRIAFEASYCVQKKSQPIRANSNRNNAIKSRYLPMSGGGNSLLWLRLPHAKHMLQRRLGFGGRDNDDDDG
mmetsp:Transcript_8283/g.20896  ORF Transcript_8283/g.20896 Transcript_8283/m.20896 type:complete len:1040 (-) Transcript_8283:111-3230(-)